MAKAVETQPRIAPYGSWASPVSAGAIAAGVIGLSQIQIDGDDVYWVEQRPAEAGRNVVVRYNTKQARAEDVTPKEFNARTRVHEYGGGAYLVSDGTVWFTNYKDQRLYRQDSGVQPAAITPAKDIRHADMVLDARHGRLIAVREDHSTGSQWPVNSIVAIPIAHFNRSPSPSGGGQGGGLIAGNDFYASPRVSPSGTQLCWLTWNHPNMPWDGTELWVADLTDDGELHDARIVAGGSDESIYQPTWSPAGELYFMSDRTNWWNLYRLRNDRVDPVFQIDAELGGPLWQLGMSTFAFDSERRIVCQVRSGGIHSLVMIDAGSGRVDGIDIPYTALQPWIRAGAGRACTIAGSPTEPLSIIAVTLDSGRVEVLRRSDDIDTDPAFISVPQTIEFQTEGGLTAHAFYYPPVNPDYQAPPNERPPLIVMVHGGPTGAVSNALDLEDQYWTTRGFAVVVVNYGGSTGYGREYRERLYGKWGIVDVDDSINAARYLIDRGLADERRMAITGGSAGGYTVLRAVTVSDFFKAGAAYYGLSELEVFHADTHKFESRYDEHLIGRWPEDRQVYHDRSPLYSIERVSAPLILFQGLEDKVVPPKQSELIVEALRKKGLPVAYIAYEGEQHGFRIASNIKRSLEAELYFYSRVFGFALHDPIEPVEIENLQSAPAP